MKPALIRRHGECGPPALLADWLRVRGIPFEVDRSWVGGPLPDPDQYAFVASLGSKHSPRDTHEPAVAAELGWREIETDDPEIVPAGPWLEWHYERFTTPPDAVEVARPPDASQALRLGPHLGVQFHPESTVDIVARWASLDADRLAAHAIDGFLAQTGHDMESAGAAGGGREQS